MAISSNPIPYGANALRDSDFTDFTKREQDMKSFNERTMDMVKYGIPAAGIGAVDTIVNSLTPQELYDDESMSKFIDSLSEPLGQYYTENREGAQTIGEIVSAVVPILGATKLMRVGSWAERIASKSALGQKYSKYVFSSGKTRADLMRQIEQEGKLFTDAKGLSFNEWGDQALDIAARRAKITAAGDMLKESIAADVAITAFYNESDMFFPEDMSALTNFALFAVPDLALTGLAYRFTGTAIKRFLQERFGEELATKVNTFGKAGTSAVSLPGLRGPQAAMYGRETAIAKADMELGDNPALIQSGNQRKSASEQLLVEQIIQMGKDDVFGHGITHKIEFTTAAGEVQNLRKAIQEDPTLAVGIRSVEVLTEKSQTSIPGSITKRLDTLEAEAKELAVDLEAADKGIIVENLESKIAKFDEIQSQLKDLKSVRSTVVLEVDQSITPLEYRKFSPLDNPTRFDEDVKTITDAGEEIYTFKQPVLNELGIEIGVTQHGKLLVTPIKDASKNTVLGGVNLTTVVSTGDRAVMERERSEMKLLLRDMSLDWHYENGAKGRPIFSSLPEELRREISNWTGSSGSSKLREWFKTGDPRAKQIIDAYDRAGLHRRLHEVADTDGTITLWRVEAKAETANPTNDVVSMAATPDVKDIVKLQTAGKNVIKRRVPVEDVIMIVGGLGDEAEYIVKGNLRRNKQALGSAAEEAIGIQTWDQRMRTWGLMQKALDNYDPVKMEPVFIHGESNMMELDFAFQLMQKYPEQNVVRMVRGGKEAAATVADLKWNLIGKKFEEYQKLKAVQDGQKNGLLKLKGDQVLSDYDIARMINLPNPTVGGKHPMIVAFDELVPHSGGQLQELKTYVSDIGEFGALMKKHINFGKMDEPLINDWKVTGSSLLPDLDRNLKPAVLISSDKYSGRIGKEELATHIMANKLYQNSIIEKIRALPEDQQYAPLHKAIYDELMSRPEDLKLATRPDLIFEGTGKNKGIFGQQSETFSNTPVLQAMDRLKDLADKAALSLIKKVFAGPDGEYTRTFNKILSNNNAASLNTFNLAVNSMQHGWRLLPEPKQINDKLWGFVLDPNWEFNYKQYKELFGRDLAADMKAQGGEMLMPVRASVKHGAGEMPTPAAVDELALKTMKALEQIDHRYLDEYNVDRELRKLAPIKKKPWHLPVINLQEGVTIYLADSSGHLKGMVNQPTHAEAIRVANKEIEAAQKDGRNWIKVDEYTVRQYHETMGEIWENPKNFSMPEFQTGSSQGKLGTRTVQFGKMPLNRILEQQQRNYELLVRNTFATMFESEMNYTRSHIMADTLGDRAARKTKSQLHQQYERVVLGKSALTPNGMIGRTYYAVESVADDFFRAAWDKLHAVKHPTAASLETEFGQLDNTLGNYNPFKSSLEMLEANENITIPPSLRKVVTKLNGFTTDMVLRVLDFGMPIINFASLASVTPSVVAALRKMPDESVLSWKARIGAIASPVDGEFAMPNTTKMVLDGMEAFFSPEYQNIRKLAASRGYIKQEVAERLNLWTSPHQGWLARNRDKIINMASTPTDWSETMSRDIAFGMMFNIGKKTMQLDDEAAMLFAHTHANKVIGDFRPTNRPQMFQGAAGMPLGLFSTWAINWLQRVFGDIEAGRMGATFWQAGMQQFLFGANSMPGVQNFMETFTASYDGKGNAADALESRYGEGFADWFLHGTLSSLTGVAFGSRADVSLPAVMTGESWGTAVPAFNLMATMGEGLVRLVSDMRQQGFDANAIGETLAVYQGNGFLRNVIQVAQNTSVDRYGAVVENNIRTFENIIPRLMELKSQRETDKAREMQRDRMQREIQRGNVDRLSRQLRTAVRSGNIDGELIESALADYYAATGSIDGFKRYVREQVLTASFEKSSRLLLTALRQSDEQGKVARLIRLTGDDFGY